MVPTDWWEEKLGWRNVFEHIPAVQLNHRLLAYSTALVGATTIAMARKIPLPPRVRAATYLVGGMLCVQISLGVSTLWFHVPIELAAPHQFGSVMLLSTFIWLLHTLRPAASGYRMAQLSTTVVKNVSRRV
jgi:cytochrome c oxidase assembly protein subunit 15